MSTRKLIPQELQRCGQPSRFMSRQKAEHKIGLGRVRKTARGFHAHFNLRKNYPGVIEEDLSG
ncbi:hypothetical protein [Tunturiibacter lichenicola]|uniref:hypothetical protein n=1 Tax=Tunturiibacter lichenicola TaxID=2051959 RepID=UPI0021B1D370|nr:hypothetical protein [Edaphobacter lichenicola]